MNAQSECSGSLGRTRARKSEETNSDVKLEKSSKKRVKMCVSKEEIENVSDNEKTLISKEGEEVVIENGDLIVESLKGDEQKIDQLKCADEELVKSDLLESKEEINNDGLNGETQVVLEKTPRRFTRSALKASEEEPVINSKKSNVSLGKTKTRFMRSSLDSVAAEMARDANKEPGKDSMETPEKTRFTCSSLDLVAAEMARDDNKEPGKDSMETPEKTRFTRSSLDSLAMDMVRDDNKELRKDSAEASEMEAHTIFRETLENVAEKIVRDIPENDVEDTIMGTSDKLLTCSALDHKTDEMLIDDDRKEEISLAEKPSSDIMEHVAVIPENSDRQLLSLQKPGSFAYSASETKLDDLTMDDNMEVQNSSVEKSNLEPKEQLVTVTESSDGQNVPSGISTKRFPRIALHVNKDLVVSPISNQLNVSSEKPLRRFTRSLLEPKAEPTGISEIYEQQNVTPEKSMKRFTRSLLEPKLEHEVIDSSNEVNNGLSEEAPRRFTRSTLKPQEERIDTSEYVLINSPSNVNELFETGMLETTELGGIIKELGILCSCILCKGEKVVTPCQFEQHAGGTNEHSAECIYLENGSSLKEVLDFLKDVPLEKLETRIQSAISTVHVKNTSTCMYCKGPLPGSKRVVQVCNKCLETRRSGASPARKTSAERLLQVKVSCDPKVLAKYSKAYLVT